VADEPTLRELRHDIDRNYDECRAIERRLDRELDETVRRDVYEAERDALTARVANLEQDAATARSRAHTALWTAGAAVIGAVVTVVVNALLHTGGVHP
jgi:fructosamine-3-kinase